MGIFLLFYKFLLEKESIHHFKRFFLLLALMGSFIIPSIVFTEYIETVPTNISTQVLNIETPTEFTTETEPVVQEIEKKPFNWSLILWSVYGIGVVGFGFRFIRHLYQIWSRIRNNTRLKQPFNIKVLLLESLPPHTFFNYIFLNKQKYEANSIPNVVLLHEETHSAQKHSLDVLFIEFIQVIFWFNPIIHFYKICIKLNHEFLADRAVLNGQEDHLNYQKTLLSYLSNDSFNTHKSIGIANAINYSSIKKRFIIMKKQTSKKSILLRSLLLLPVLTLMLYGFSQKNVVSKNTIKDINIEITKTGSLLINNEPVGLEKLSEKALNINQNIDTYIFKNYITAHILYDENQYKLIDQVQSELQSVGIFNIEHFSKRTTGIFNQNGFASSDYDGKTVSEAKEIRKNNVLNGFKTDVNNEPLLEIAWIEIKDENEIWFNNNQIELSQLSNSVASEFPLAVKSNKLAAQIYSTEIINLNLTDAISKELRKLNTKSITIYSDKYIIPADDYKEDLEITPKATISETNNHILQDNATKEQISTYNKLAKSYNSMISKGGNIRIMKADLDNLNYIYRLMSTKQKTAAEPFPEFPEPPPAPKAPKVAKGEKSDIPLTPSPHVKKEDTDLIPPPPSPPTPPSPLDYAIGMAKKGATFFYQGKEVSSDKAIDLLKKNKELNIESKAKNGIAEVRITKEPVTIE
ncbi:M56 family metallopeptidase [Maribacter spongiicola]|uniref:M56 family metallopeptidase n=1 Tax=Maribacter spongiicola TaxID=1206753 RepID=UPI003F9BDF19